MIFQIVSWHFAWRPGEGGGIKTPKSRRDGCANFEFLERAEFDPFLFLSPQILKKRGQKSKHSRGNFRGVLPSGAQRILTPAHPNLRTLRHRDPCRAKIREKSGGSLNNLPTIAMISQTQGRLLA